MEDHGRRAAGALRVAMLVIAALALAPGRAAALHKDALASLAADLETRTVTLKSDLHEPDLRGESMIAPTLERRGWHHNNPGGPVVMRAGSKVEVTAIFNYSERGLFLELAGEPAGEGRPRLRIRIVVEAPDTDPAAQRAEAIDLIGKVIEVPAAP